MFGRSNWVKAEGLVVAEQFVSADIFMRPTYEYVIEVRPPGRDPFGPG